MTKKIQIELEKEDEVLERKITKFSNSSHVILPAKHEGKHAKIIINKKKTKLEEKNSGKKPYEKFL